MRRNDLAAQVARHRLHARLNGAVAGLPEQPSTPTYVVDLDPFDSNAADLARRAAGTPVRVATKSLRVPALIERALASPGFSGLLGLLAARGAVAVRAGDLRRRRDGLPVRRPPGAGPADRLRAGAGGRHADGRRRPPARPGRLGAGLRRTGPGRGRRGRRPAGRAGARRAPALPAVRHRRRGRAGRGDRPPRRVPDGRGDDLRGTGRRRPRRGPPAPVPLGRGALAEEPVGGAAGGPAGGHRLRAARGRRAGVLERRRLRLGGDLGRRPGRDRGDRRVRAAGARPVRPLPVLLARCRPPTSGCAWCDAPRRRWRPWRVAAWSPRAPSGADRSPVPWAPPGLQPDDARGRR